MTKTDPRESYKPGAGEIPTAPGVYRFSDGRGRVLYIGKAKNLRARVSNYFQPLRTLPPRTQRMLQLARSVDWTVVGSDTEALTLEHSWITQFQPPYNVQFRDDKTYPSLAVTLKDEAPRLLITRNLKISGAKYFGPFPKVWALKQMAAALQEAFPIRTCSPADYARAMASGKPCLSGQIGKCFGPCSGKLSFAEHRQRVQEMIRFLNGYDTSLLNELTREMDAAAADFEYERAAQLRDQIVGVKHVLEQNVMVLSHETALDVFGVASDEVRATIHQFVIRQGRIRSEYSWMVNFELDMAPERLLEQAIQAAYDEREVPTTILVPFLPQSLPELTEVLQKRRESRGKVTITVPQRGEKKQILERATINAKEQLNRFKLKRASDLIARTDALAQIQTALELPLPPMRIECIDVSHLGGSGVVASLVVFEDGLPKKSEYRSFRVVDGRDDTSAISEVITRRVRHLAENDANKWPELLLIDGGQPQVNAAERALRESNMPGSESIAVASLAKRLEELWLPQNPFPVIFARSSEALFLLQRIRDEAHRFAITHQRKTRKAQIGTALTEIAGVGPGRAKKLLNHFGSLAKVKKASVDEIAAVSGIGPELATGIHNHLNPPKQGNLES